MRLFDQFNRALRTQENKIGNLRSVESHLQWREVELRHAIWTICDLRHRPQATLFYVLERLAENPRVGSGRLAQRVDNPPELRAGIVGTATLLFGHAPDGDGSSLEPAASLSKDAARLDQPVDQLTNGNTVK
jgi:hypothetical protein